eukprot:NODE_4720_length_1026_cov_117.530454_g4516_i0.p1 GENE.NODE_4720_length_1026_cov_117.530454_g4516_i0~~NODE_4720_length_1026_cov_117.530454_g4516_i0.p1  ORF type:complete len:247 (+),score=53.99 NODE_4720_length_1026_cov_117.530454_g4516_i0:78-818(+)
MNRLFGVSRSVARRLALPVARAHLSTRIPQAQFVPHPILRTPTRLYSTEQGKSKDGQEPDQEARKEEPEQEKEAPTEEEEAEGDPVATLEAKLESAQEEVKQAKNQLAYALADAENVRKISRKDVARAREYAVKGFAKDLLEVGDNLDRALDIFPKDTQDATIRSIQEGIVMTQSLMEKVLTKHGVEKMTLVPGETEFDPSNHNAVTIVPAPAGMDGGVVHTVIKSGYTLKDRVLRAADVIVTQEE